MSIGEFMVYNITSGREPNGTAILSYRLDALSAPENSTLEPLLDYIEGRFLPDERNTMVALPSGIRLDPKETADLARTFHLSKEQRETMVKAREYLDRLQRQLSQPEMQPSHIHQLLHPLPLELLLLLLAHTTDSRVTQRINLYLTRLRTVKIAITGDDLKAMGYQPSPRFHHIMNEVTRARLDGIVQSKEDELKLVRERFPRGASP